MIGSHTCLGIRLILEKVAVTKAEFGALSVKRILRSPVFSILTMSATADLYMGTLLPVVGTSNE